MKSIRFVGLLAVLIVLCGASAEAQITEVKPMPNVVIVKVGTRALHAIPAEVFGGFLEPIGNSINGGISAELLTNGSLEAGLWNHTNLENLFRTQPELIDSTNDTGIPMPWMPVSRAAGNRFELHVGQAANSWQSLEILGTLAGETGMKQKVYLPVQRELNYRASIFAKHISGPTELKISLRSRSTGKVLADAEVKAESAEWTKYTVALKLPAGAVQRLEAVDFVVTVQATERAEIDEISLMPQDAVSGLDPDELAMAKAMNLTELRLGGNFSSYYHWKDGVGPLDKRPVMENIAWGIPEYNKFGTDEFLKMCELTGAVPQFDLNLGSGTPEEAVEWVKYIQSHWKGKVIYELGNELYGHWQVGWKTDDEIGPATLAFSKAVRAAAPDAQIIATGLGAVNDEKWNEGQLKNPTGTFDLLSLHYIIGTNRPAMMNPTPDFMAAAAYAIPYALGPHFDKVQERIDAHGAHGKVHQAVTEWLFNSKGFGERNFTDESPSWMNEGGAVMAAGFLNTVLRHADQITLTDMTGIMEFAGIWKKREQVYAVPAYYAFKMYTEVKGDSVLPVETDSGTYDVAGGVRPFDNEKGIPYIDVVATRSADGGTLTLLCVNRSLERDVAVRFDLGTLKPTGSAHSQRISADSRYEMNDEFSPNHVVPVPAMVPASAAGTMTATLPHESVTVLRVPVR
jgi:alpha-L-arabinofuranosidase